MINYGKSLPRNYQKENCQLVFHTSSLYTGNPGIISHFYIKANTLVGVLIFPPYIIQTQFITMQPLNGPLAITLLFIISIGSATLHLRTSNTHNAAYWGQSTSENEDLSQYCTKDAGIDIILLAFLNSWGNGLTIPSGQIGNCVISAQGDPQGCDNLANAIRSCQSNGVRVILSLGGATGTYSLLSRIEAESIGQNLWDAYGSSSANTVPRPFGTTVLDGWDFSIENSAGNEFYQYMITTLRSNFASDPTKPYYVTGAPQCYLPERNMGAMISQSQFDYLWVQFYNNPSCSNPNPINYEAWENYIAGTASSQTKIFIGVPASPLAANNLPSGEIYYFEPSELASLASDHRSDAAWGGFMMWSAGYSDTNVINGCTYAQQAKYILEKGSPCPIPTPTTSTPTTSTPTTSTPITSTPITSTPITSTPITSTPITSTPITSTPITSTPITSTPTTSTPITSTPITSTPITSTPTTSTPITSTPTTSTPTTSTPTTSTPITSTPTTFTNHIYTNLT
ncbi:glycoside hydrolase superfamily [Talaromyces proteolyticus]|uniref:Glycoside hydrolase superfamily n=1 Tax=Talaromyces proteolyticus TaxID=1131652 RepID=A0AAD4KI69_9EURO|nr:glycoside hydrolase superfamily [Talaromyces proteolyticus]KAH8691837.1 glycoside hydrolase superfamily [Talaromyces proteolyticus]